MTKPKPIDNGGPAFPGSQGEHGCGCDRRISLPNGEVAWERMNQGMSLRDYFAAKALTGIIANATHWDSQDDEKQFAYHAYKIADAMLTARKENL